MQVKTICGLLSFRTDTPNNHFKFANSSLAQGDQILIQQYSTDKFVSIVGRANMGNLISNPYFYAIYTNVPEEVNIGYISQLIIDNLSILMTYLWFIKDNSCNIQACFNYDPENGHITSLNTNSHNSNAFGEISEVAFSHDELNRAVELLSLSENLFSSNKQIDADLYYKTAPNKSGVHAGMANKVEYNFRNRIERAILFLASTRSSHLLPSKISNYMNVYECLFTTDAIEVNHKISERVAFYIGTNKAERIEIFKLIKEAYTIRSKYFHGQELPTKYKSAEVLRTLSLNIDILTRKVLLKVITQDSQVFLENNEVLGNWFTDLIFQESENKL